MELGDAWAVSLSTFINLLLPRPLGVSSLVSLNIWGEAQEVSIFQLNSNHFLPATQGR